MSQGSCVFLWKSLENKRNSTISSDIWRQSQGIPSFQARFGDSHKDLYHFRPNLTTVTRIPIISSQNCRQSQGSQVFVIFGSRILETVTKSIVFLDFYIFLTFWNFLRMVLSPSKPLRITQTVSCGNVALPVTRPEAVRGFLCIFQPISVLNIKTHTHTHHHVSQFNHSLNDWKTNINQRKSAMRCAKIL